MRLTVCELPDNRSRFIDSWRGLCDHVETERSELVLLPEMPFSRWLPMKQGGSEEKWGDAVEAHDDWMDRMNELAPATVLGSRPTHSEGRRLNEGFVWTESSGSRLVHQKTFLPDDGPWFWEGSWYERGEDDFSLVECASAKCGFLICTEIWGAEQARKYGHDGAHLIVNPRVTEPQRREQWRAGTQAISTISGSFVASSNRVTIPTESVEEIPFGGNGWIVDPDGTVLAETSRNQPFVTVEIDISVAEKAKKTYPRPAFEGMERR
ncbi:carbon-nitrogen hydrolase family protein [Natrarchaeobius halalkaliphilus]|uniref:Carbon-nitrogen hydrolase family protein n=1 Tax=Natrarchaeobius halalkaliphilus TaxID=1679091 RepID=A0A3N6MTE7_9EURY|nr:carbon-nitrogen hydrolase family protein [Natrarchaeobius halalkaliphilus]RQG88075.1 carbon-nitrogen hydrolase family protein [Natrarchaeobius halalkaliphilus]